jgi:predicted aspartyl protease
MSLIFPYTEFPTPKPVWSLQGRAGRPRPLILVAIIGPTATVVERCLLDTGADDTVFPEAMATHLGIDLSGCPTSSASGVGQVGATLRHVEVRLRITDGQETREWPARVAFTSAPLRWPLLGFAGFLQFFTATFHGDHEQVELTVNGSYPGT